MVSQKTRRGTYEIPSVRLALHFSKPWFDLARLNDAINRTTRGLLRVIRGLGKGN